MRWLALLLLAGCAAPDPLPDVTIPLRNPTAPIASQADVTLARLSGDWIVTHGAGLAPGTRITVTDAALSVAGTALPLVHDGAGRFVLAGDPLWVHWLDVGNRTAALGDPNGTRVWIMDRTGRPGDRLAPAREILEWYGYDLNRMEDA